MEKSPSGRIQTRQWTAAAMCTLGGVVLVGLVLRLYQLEHIFLWYDETELFNERLFISWEPLRQFTASVVLQHTVSAGWPAILWGVTGLFGDLAAVARLPSVILGTAAIPAVFALVAYSAPVDAPRWARLSAGLIGAVLVAISIPQIEFSQRVYPYSAMPVAASLLGLLHIAIAQVLERPPLRVTRLLVLAATYVWVSVVGLFLHLSLSMVIATSGILLLLRLRSVRRMEREAQVALLAVAILGLTAVGSAWIGNFLHSQKGYRFYLDPYYHGFGWTALPFLASRTYDLVTYHVNLFYNGGLYWPRSLNPVLLPLVVVSTWGWIRAVRGKLGERAREVARLLALGAMLLALLSLRKQYPYGGIRQTLILSPFLLSMTAYGIWSLMRHRAGLAVAGLGSLLYLLLWGVNLPRFYHDRVQPYSTDELVDLWSESGGLTMYVDGGADQALKYTLRSHPEIEVAVIRNRIPAPYLYVSTHWPLDRSLWMPEFAAHLDSTGMEARLLREIPPTYPLEPDFRQSLYHPPNGLWVYEVTAGAVGGAHLDDAAGRSEPSPVSPGTPRFKD